MEVVSWAVGLLVRLGIVSPWNSLGGVDSLLCRCRSVSRSCCRSFCWVDSSFDKM